MTRALLVLALPALALTLSSCSNGAAIDGVQEFKVAQGHKAGKLSYAQTPPAGGEHNPSWQNCGVYDRPLYNEFAVHSMEHGAVWITYRPDLAADEVNALRALVENRSHALLSPYPGLGAPVVVSAWGAQLKLDSAQDPRLPKFLAQYEQGKQTPELGASCSGASSETQ